ncbi:MAG: cereblon family protein [Pseudomonadota bacterium]
MEFILPASMFFDPHSEKKRKEKINTRLAEKTKKEKRLFCAACRHPVTHQDERIIVQGGHEHRCTNPQGITYHIGCFREAAGCAPSGEATAEFTWFKGYAWRIAYCAHCQVHLGWRFQSDGDYFHGLIVDRLTSVGPVKN